MARENKKSDEVKKWQNRIAFHEAVLNQYARRSGWERYMEEYRLIWRILEGRWTYPLFPVNLVHAFVKTEVPSLYFRDPYIAVNPTRKDPLSLVRAKVTESALKHEWRKILRMKNEIKRCIVDALVVGHAWVKIGYQADFESALSAEGGGQGKSKKALEVDDRIVSEDIFSYRLGWRDVLFDNTISRHPPQDCRWMAFRFVKPTEALKRSGRYKNTENLKPNFTLYGKANEGAARFEGAGDIEFTVGWEVWDKDSKSKFIVVEGHPAFLQDPVDWPYPFKSFPCEMLTFTEDPEGPYGFSAIAPWEPELVEKIKFRNMAVNHIKRGNRQIIAKKGIFSKSELDKYLKNIDGSVVFAKSANLSADILVPAYAAFQPDAYAIEDRIDQDLRNVAGQPETKRGATMPTKTRTLGELDMINQYSTIRVSEREDIVEDFCEGIARKQIALMQKFFDLDHLAVITETTPEEDLAVFRRYFNQGKKFRFFERSFSYTREDLLEDPEVEVRAGSSLSLNRETRQQILSSVLQSTAQYLPPNIVLALLREFIGDFEMKSMDAAFDEAERQSRVSSIVQEALGRQQETVRRSAVEARTMRAAAGEGGLEAPP